MKGFLIFRFLLFESKDMNKKKKPPIPISGVVYGEIIYWCTCVSALVVLFGTIKSFLEVDQTIPVEYLLNAVFEGRSVEAVWAGSVLQNSPDALTYLAILNSGEAITAVSYTHLTLPTILLV